MCVTQCKDPEEELLSALLGPHGCERRPPPRCRAWARDINSTSTATHVDEQCGCSIHSLFLGRVGRSEVMHRIASFVLHLEVYLYLYEAIDVSIIMQFKFDA